MYLKPPLSNPELFSLPNLQFPLCGNYAEGEAITCLPLSRAVVQQCSEKQADKTAHSYTQLWFSWFMAGHTCHVCLIFSGSNKPYLQSNEFCDLYSSNYFLILIFKDFYSDFLGRCRVWLVCPLEDTAFVPGRYIQGNDFFLWKEETDLSHGRFHFTVAG